MFAHSYCLYVDDIRLPTTQLPWIVKQSAESAIEYVVKHGFPEYISFDHDLGENVMSGYDFAKWLVEYDMDTGLMPETFAFNVHSANPVGATNITEYLNNYLKVKHEDRKG